MAVAINEQETVIQFSRNSKFANIWTTDSTVMTKLDKYVKEDNSPWKLKQVGRVGDEIVSKEYKVIKELVSFRSRKVNRVMSDEEKLAAAERLKEVKMRNNN